MRGLRYRAAAMPSRNDPAIDAIGPTEKALPIRLPMPTVCMTRPSVTFHAPHTKNCMNMSALSRPVSIADTGCATAPETPVPAVLMRTPLHCAALLLPTFEYVSQTSM